MILFADGSNIYFRALHEAQPFRYVMRKGYHQLISSSLNAQNHKFSLRPTTRKTRAAAIP